MNKISVMGAGTMGADIAYVFASKGFKVVLRDIKDVFVEKGQAHIEKLLNKLESKGKITAEAKAMTLANLTFTTSLDLVADSDLVIEAIVENTKIKQDLFRELDGICKEDTIFASNTSSISITELASAVKRTDKFIGMHFFNPASVMKLVEIIKGVATSVETFEIIKNLCEKISKEGVEVNEAPGFVVNKILIPMINEGICVLEQGVASKEDIDKAMMLGANHPMGPLALADLIGLDIVLNIMNVLHNETGDSKYRPSVLLKKMVRAGLLGRKTSEGFYKY